MDFDPLPVDPTLEDGPHGKKLLSVLRPLLAEGAEPVPLGDGGGKWDTSLSSRHYATSVCADLGVSAAFSAQSSVNSSTFVWNGVVGKRRVLETTTATSAIFETLWGVGLRVLVTCTTTDVGMETNLGVVAARAEAKGIDTRYEIHAVGLGAKELALVLRKIPPLGRFDLGAYHAIDEVRQGLVAALTDSLTNEPADLQRLRPLQIRLSASPFQPALVDAAVWRFVMRCVRDGMNLAAALALRESKWSRLPADRVEAVFRRVVGGGAAPSAKLQAQADTWLAVG